VSDGETRARPAEARVEELTAERARLWEEVHHLRSERREDEHFRDLARYMESTASWKITRPLRDLKRLYIGLRRFAGK
jgi:hypothetical protein